MLTRTTRPLFASALFVAAIVAGSVIGIVSTDAGASVQAFADPLILVLVALMFFTLRLEGFGALRRAPRVVGVALVVNFLVIPLVAWPLTALLPDEALRFGVLIYLLAPCTDWFLGFTRIAGGDTTTGAALIPLQMMLQLLLYPVWLVLFAGERTVSVMDTAAPSLLTWFILPAAVGLALRALLRATLPYRARTMTVTGADRAVPIAIAAVIVAIFAGNISVIVSDMPAFGWVLALVAAFFVVMYVIGEGASRLARLRFSEHALITVTTSARNAPMMIAVTSLALPDQPVVTAAIVVGMLVEFPHLTVLTHLLRRRARTESIAATNAPVSLEASRR